MNKIAIALLSCALMLTGLVAFAQPKINYQAASIDRAETKRFLALENPVKKVTIKKTYKKNEQLSPKDLKAILYEAGFRGANLKEAWAVAMKESTGRPRSHNDNPDTGDNSHGLFQINMIGSLGPARLKQYNLDSYDDLFNPLTNAEIAFQMSDGGKNWSSWNGIGSSTTKWFAEYPD
jgi:hypothetical protein